MNRQIKFRGKVVYEPNEWVYGYLCNKNAIYQSNETEYTKCCGKGIFLVRPETIGQFTGLKDKNGIEIYEGDIVKAKFFEKHITGKIEFTLGAFFVTGSAVSDNQMFIFNDFEVIGNIYDNKNLLEE